MKETNQIIKILLCFFCLNSYSQNKFLDYIVTEKNDTIFGTIKNDPLRDKVLFEKNQNFNKGGVKYFSHKLKKIKSLRINDRTYTYKKPSNDDGIYEETKDFEYKDSNLVILSYKDFLNIKPRLSDYIITNSNDTIFGEIKNPIFGKVYLLDKNKVKYKIEKECVKSYRYSNEIYQYFEKRKVAIFDDRNAYLKLLYNGKIKLFEYVHTSKQPNQNINYFYYILKENELYLIRNINYKETLSKLFEDNPELILKIKEEEYTLENIYLIVKYYNENK